MPASSAGLISKTIAVYAKDIRLELRSRYAVSIVLMFAISTLVIISFAVGQAGLNPKVQAALLWVILFFSAMAGLAQTFIKEEESGTALALRLSTEPVAVFLGKFLFNLTLLTFITAIVTPLFFVMTEASTERVGLFVLPLVLGVFGLCTSTTLIAAIIAKASTKGALFSVVSFPLLIPLLLMLVGATAKLLANEGFEEIAMETQGLAAYSVVMMVASLMLFRFVWRD